MPLAEWPALDRDAWATALEDGDILSGRGPAAHWRPETRRSVIAAYGRYLTFLERSGWLERDAGPEARLTPDRLRAYLAELDETIAPVTISSRVTGLTEALRIMDPEAAYPYLNLARRRLKVRARPTRNKRARIVPTQQLFDLGLELIERAESGAFEREIWRACTYRDGVIILLLACRPIRRRNLAAMELGKHLIKTGDSYRIAFDGSETKNHRQYERPIDPRLTPFIDRYLEHYRADPPRIEPSEPCLDFLARHPDVGVLALRQDRRTHESSVRPRGLPTPVPRFGDDDAGRAGPRTCLARYVRCCTTPTRGSPRSIIITRLASHAVLNLSGGSAAPTA